MIVINKSDGTKYLSIIHRALNPGQKSADVDCAGLCKALRTVVNACGKSCYVRLNSEESFLMSRLLELDKDGCDYRCSAKNRPSHLQKLMANEMIEKRAKIASIRASQAKEASIKDETTYASRRDIDDAKAKSKSIKGEVEARKLDKDVTGTVSLRELMSDNKFIEESMKNSNVRTVVAGEDGWDVDKINEANKAIDDKAQEHETPTASEPDQETEAEAKPSKRRRRSSK